MVVLATFSQEFIRVHNEMPQPHEKQVRPWYGIRKEIFPVVFDHILDNMVQELKGLLHADWSPELSIPILLYNLIPTNIHVADMSKLHMLHKLFRSRNLP